MAQTLIFLLGALSIFLVSCPDPWRYWGFVVMLAAQPLWFYETLNSGQLGEFGLTIVHFLVAINGLRTNRGNRNVLKRIMNLSQLFNRYGRTDWSPRNHLGPTDAKLQKKEEQIARTAATLDRQREEYVQMRLQAQSCREENNA